MLFLIALGIIGGMVVPFQTSINSRLSLYTRSSFYASTISFGVGTLCLILLNLLLHPNFLHASHFHIGHLDWYWFSGGLLGVIFLTGNLLLLPRLGASLTVVMSVSGQIIMGVMIDTFGWLGAPHQAFTLFKALGMILLIIGIIIMNEVRQTSLQNKASISFYIWLIIGFIFGFTPPLQTAINSKLGQQLHSPTLASLISFGIGTVTLLLLTLVFHRSLKVQKHHASQGSLKPFYFIGGLLGVIFVTMNIILMPYLGAAVTTIAGMLGQMLMGLIIDHFGLLGTPVRKITVRKMLGMLLIILGIVLLRLF